MAFRTGKMFPARHLGGVFVAAHGSWNRTTPSGALINFVSVKADGMDGLSKLSGAPHIAGQPEPYLVRALRAYRSGERRDEAMGIAARGLSDDDIRNLAAYYSSFRIEVSPRAP